MAFGNGLRFFWTGSVEVQIAVRSNNMTIELSGHMLCLHLRHILLDSGNRRTTGQNPHFGWKEGNRKNSGKEIHRHAPQSPQQEPHAAAMATAAAHVL